jgi:hypothetical protein
MHLFSKKTTGYMLKKNLLWFHVLSREAKSFHAQPSRTHSNSSSQPIKSFTTHYQHVPSAFPLRNRALFVSFCSLTQQRPGENLSIIAQEKVFLPSPLALGTEQFSKTIQPVAFRKTCKMSFFAVDAYLVLIVL